MEGPAGEVPWRVREVGQGQYRACRTGWWRRGTGTTRRRCAVTPEAMPEASARSMCRTYDHADLDAEGLAEVGATLALLRSAASG